jgi:hypothetical protein
MFILDIDMLQYPPSILCELVIKRLTCVKRQRAHTLSGGREVLKIHPANNRSQCRRLLSSPSSHPRLPALMDGIPLDSNALEGCLG